VLSGLTEHRRPPRNCPVYFNDEEDIRWNTGPVSFCPGCLAKLRRNPARGALKALLKAS